MDREPLILAVWGGLWVVVSLWASGFSFKHPRWQAPRVSLVSRILLFVDGFLKRVVKQSILELHKKRNSLSYRLFGWALMLSDFEQLSKPQRLERALWTQVAMVAFFSLVLGIALAIT